MLTMLYNSSSGPRERKHQLPGTSPNDVDMHRKRLRTERGNRTGNSLLVENKATRSTDREIIEKMKLEEMSRYFQTKEDILLSFSSSQTGSSRFTFVALCVAKRVETAHDHLLLDN